MSFSNNATREWLEKKSDAEQAKILEAARRLAPSHIELFKEQCRLIWEYQKQQLLLKQQKLGETRKTATREGTAKQ